MMNYFKGTQGSWMWLVLRLYVGYQFLTAGWHKLTGATPFDAAGYIKGGIAKILVTDPKLKPITAEWWGTFLKNVALPNVSLFNFLVQWGEILVGLALIVGFATIFAATMGALMNFAFLMTGSTSSNPYLFALQAILVAAGGAYAGYLGVDYWFRPMFRNYVAKLFGAKGATVRSAA